MKQISISKGKIALVDDDDYDFIIKNKWSFSAGYAIRRRTIKVDVNLYKFETLSMHRVIMGVTDSDILIDHIDGNKLNNQKSNLRLANKSQNGANRKTKKHKYLGVSPLKNGKFLAHIQVRINNQTEKYNKIFNNENEAAKWRDEMAIKLHGEFAKIN